MSTDPRTNGRGQQQYATPSQSEATIEIVVDGWEKPLKVKIPYETPPPNIDRQMIAQGLINHVLERGFLGRRIKEGVDEFEFAPVTKVGCIKVRLSDIVLVGSGVTLQ